MTQISIAEASKNLTQYIDAGEEIIITKDNQPVVRLAPITPSIKRDRQPGSAKGSVWMSDDFEESLGEFKEYM